MKVKLSCKEREKWTRETSSWQWTMAGNNDEPRVSQPLLPSIPSPDPTAIMARVSRSYLLGFALWLFWSRPEFMNPLQFSSASENPTPRALQARESRATQMIHIYRSPCRPSPRPANRVHVQWSVNPTLLNERNLDQWYRPKPMSLLKPYPIVNAPPKKAQTFKIQIKTKT